MPDVYTFSDALTATSGSLWGSADRSRGFRGSAIIRDVRIAKNRIRRISAISTAWALPLGRGALRAYQY